ncbi:MAG: hypothetical protein EHM42_10300 [Planctomycetaceae bacterium]|nr:MAG: hypothetical protein EHM42_10300 [Planctomycetaceae bacterium]
MGGGVSLTRDLIAGLHPAVSVFALQPRLDEQTVECFSSFTAAAGLYANLIRKFQPHGPYSLIGYCYGGGVAYEIARVLTEQGERVELLVLLDAVPTANNRQTGLKATLARGARIARNLPGWIRDDMLQTRQPQFWRRSRRKLRAWGRALWRRLAGVNAGSHLDDLMDLSRVSTQNVQLRTRLWQAQLAHQTKPAPVRIVLFRARTRGLFHGNSHDLGWGLFAAGGVEVVTLPGHHTSMLKQPNLQRVIEALNERLQRH